MSNFESPNTKIHMKREEFIRMKSEGFIEYSYSVIYRQEEDSTLTCFIPIYDIFFTTKDESEIRRISSRFMNSYFNYWVKGKSWEMFQHRITQIGFKAESQAMQKAISRASNKFKQARLRASITTKEFPEGFNPELPGVSTFSTNGNKQIAA